MKCRVFLFCASLMTAICLVTAAFSTPRPAPGDAPSGSAFLPDKGRLRILQQGSEVGTEDFELAPSGDQWMLRGETTIRASGSGDVRSTGQLRLTADGTPLHYTWTAQAEKKASGSVEFQNGTAKTSINLGAKEPRLQDFTFTSPRVAVLDNNLYDQYAILGRLYDWGAKGTQTFSVLIPQDATPGSVDVESLGPKNIEGNPLEELRVHSTDLEIELYLDAKHHLMRLEVPSAKVVIVRQ
jgi:hypothetical protein